MCEVLIGQRLQLHQGQSCDGCSGVGGTVDGGSDLRLAHCLHSFNGGSHLIEVNDVVVTGELTDVVEGSEGLVLGHPSPLNHAVESLEAFSSIDSTAGVLVDSAEDFLRLPVLGVTLWLFRAVGRRHWEFPLAVFSAMFVSLMEMMESFHGMLCLAHVKLVRSAIRVKVGVLTKELVHEDSVILFHEAPLNQAVESLEALLSVDGSVTALVNVTKDLFTRSVLKFRFGRALRAIGSREWHFKIFIDLAQVGTVVIVMFGRGRAFGSVLFDLDGSGADGEKSSSEEFHRYFWVGCFLLLIFTKIAFLLYPSIRVAVIFLVTFAF